jgi:hypothetical protein
MNRFRSDENSIISYMVNEFEMRKAADEYLRTSVSKTGVIDTNKLHSYKYNDDLFRRITTVASGKNHGFVMFLDWSGSMDSHLRKTMKQLFSLVMFCKRVQIPFDVYLFRTRSGLDGEGIANGHELYTKRPGDIVLSPFTARNILSSRMNVAELNEAMLYMWIASGDGSMYVDSLGSTPLNPCIAVASEIVNRFKARHKVQVVNVAILTDGDSDPMDATIHGVSSYGQYGSGKRMVIIQDEFTKKTYDLPKSGSYGGISASFRNFTPVLLKILKDRTGANLLGFFIADSFGRNYTRYNGFNRSTDQYKNARKSWSDYGFFGVTTAGYDEYYILDAKKFNVSSGDLKVTSGASKRKMASEFIKHNEKKTNSRILLSQVVKRISS